MYIGDEAIVDPRTFSLEGRAIRKVRQSTHRLERGLHRRLPLGDELDPATLGELDRISDGVARSGAGAWLRDGPRYPRSSWPRTSRSSSPATARAGHAHFSRSPQPTAAPPSRFPRCVAIRRRRTERRSSSSRGRWRRSESVARWRSRSTSRPSVGAARPCRPPRPAARPRIGAADRFFQIESLYRFNAKFQPERYPRYLVYDRALALPVSRSRPCGRRASFAVPLVAVRPIIGAADRPAPLLRSGHVRRRLPFAPATALPRPPRTY